MGNHQSPMQNAQTSILRGDLGFEDLRQNAAPYVSRHRMTLGNAAPLPCFGGLFGIDDIGEGQTVHQSYTDAETEFETSFVARCGLVVTLVLSGRLEFSLNGERHDIDAHENPVFLAWMNRRPVEVVRKTNIGDTLVKVQVNTPLEFFDAEWEADSHGFLQTHTKVLCWSPGLAATTAARNLIEKEASSSLKARLASQRFAIEAMDSLLEHLESHVSKKGTTRIQAARAFVEQTAVERPDLSQIAQATGFSVSALQRTYRETFGMTVIGHQRRLLLEIAKDSLQNGQMTVAEASHAAGYRTPTNFSTAFFKTFGIRPSQLRNPRQKNDV